MDSFKDYDRISKPKTIEVNLMTKDDNAKLWHKRFRHLHYARLYHLSRACQVQGLLLFHTLEETYKDCFVRQQH